MFENGDRSGIHVSDLVGCLRKAYYNRKVEEPEHIHHKIITMAGKAVHSYVELNDDNVTSEFPMSEMGVTGTTDAIYSDGITTRIMDIKTVRKMSKHMLPWSSHTLQVNIYAALLRKKGAKIDELFINYIDLNGPTKCSKCNLMVVAAEGGPKCPGCGMQKVSWHTGAYLVQVPMMEQDEVEQLIKTRTAELDASIDLGAEPAREPGVMCKFCKFIQLCQPEMENVSDGI